VFVSLCPRATVRFFFPTKESLDCPPLNTDSHSRPPGAGIFWFRWCFCRPSGSRSLGISGAAPYSRSSSCSPSLARFYAHFSLALAAPFFFLRKHLIPLSSKTRPPCGQFSGTLLFPPFCPFPRSLKTPVLVSFVTKSRSPSVIDVNSLYETQHMNPSWRTETGFPH